MPGIVYHVLNRANRRDTLFFTDHDYDAFEAVLLHAKQRFDMPLFEYVVMRNHFHLLVRPTAQRQLSRFMHWLTMTHTQRWHREHGTTGTGSLYQGRYKAVAVQSDSHFLTAARYVQRNPVRAGMAPRADAWRWSSAWRAANRCAVGAVDGWPVPKPGGWVDLVNEPDRPQEWDQLREAITRSAPFGNRRWRIETAGVLGIPHTLRRRGRPDAIGRRAFPSNRLPPVE